ncbi:unnamed protein product [Chrysoparadoxa australica]
MSEFDEVTTTNGGKHRLSIAVCNPATQGDGIKKYITYKVNTSTDRPDFQYGQFSVIRRFKDFAWLSERLGDEFPGIINPLLPEKTVVGRFEPDFIEKRRKELERYLNRVAAHEELSGSTYFRTFLQADDAGLADTKEVRNDSYERAGKTSRHQAAGGNILKWFDEAVTVVKTQVGKQEGAKTPADIKFDEIQAYVDNLDVQMLNVSKHASALVRQQEEMAKNLHQFSIAFTFLAQAEEKNTPLGQCLLSLGHCTDDVSVSSKKQAIREEEQFTEPLQEYCRFVAALKVALAKRGEKRITYLTAAHDLEAKKAAQSKLVGVAGKEEKLEAAEAAATAAQAAVEAAKNDFEVVSSRVIREFERFKTDKATFMKGLVLDFVNIQADVTKELENKWVTLIPQIESMEIG